jgi:hypothetical protein
MKHNRCEKHTVIELQAAFFELGNSKKCSTIKFQTTKLNSLDDGGNCVGAEGKGGGLNELSIDSSVNRRQTAVVCVPNNSRITTVVLAVSSFGTWFSQNLSTKMEQ